MADINARDAKLVQYLNEAYGKEKQLETALEAHIAMTTRAPYRKRLQDHLRETKEHGRQVGRRIKQLGGAAEAVSMPGPDVVGEAAAMVQDVAQRGKALAQGPLHAVRGTGEEEKLLKNAKTEYANEAEEIASYTAIETLAASVGDRETAKLARNIRRQEERMARFLERLIPQLTKAVVQSEIPAALRNGRPRRATAKRSVAKRRAGATASRRTSGSRASSSSRRSSAKASRSSASRSTSGSSRRATTRTSSRRATSGSSRRTKTSASSRRKTASGSARRKARA